MESGACRLSQDKLYQALVVAAVVVAFLAGELEVHERLWAQVGGASHDYATACRRHKDRPWVGAQAAPAARRPGAKPAAKPGSGSATHKPLTNVSGNESGKASSREHQHGGPTARGVEKHPANDGN